MTTCGNSSSCLPTRTAYISARETSPLSTCGIVPNIRRLADEELQITLALSLHASSQEKREKLMPIAKQYELSEVMDACRYYHDKTGRRLTFEYSLVGGVNDHTEDARELAGLLKGHERPCKPDSGKPHQGAGFCPADQRCDPGIQK